VIGDIILGVVGWGGSALLVVSILQSNLRRLRILNLASCVLLVAYNSVLGVWPMAAMNAALLLINAFHLIRARRQARADAIAEPAAR
jgi:hypothetical protein